VRAVLNLVLKKAKSPYEASIAVYRLEISVSYSKPLLAVTVIMSLEIHEAARFNNSTCAYRSHFIRYAFVRACQQRIVVDLPPLTPPGPEELEVVRLKEFLDATAPEVDPAVIDRRLHDVAEALNARWYQGTLPPGIEPISVLSQAEAAAMLLDFLARKVKKRLRVAIEENLEGEFPLTVL
jgi:hypothetical protein